MLEKLKELCRTGWVENHEAYENFKELSSNYDDGYDLPSSYVQQPIYE